MATFEIVQGVARRPAPLLCRETRRGRSTDRQTDSVYEFVQGGPLAFLRRAFLRHSFRQDLTASRARDASGLEDRLKEQEEHMEETKKELQRVKAEEEEQQAISEGRAVPRPRGTLDPDPAQSS